jgi:predicted Rdx family selenoprotein
MAGEALSRKGQHIESFRLIPGGHGKFDVRINGDLVAEHRHEPNAHIFPDLQDLLKALDQRIS